MNAIFKAVCGVTMTLLIIGPAGEIFAGVITYSIVAQTGDTIGGATVGEFTDFALNDNGNVVFTTSSVGTFRVFSQTALLATTGDTIDSNVVGHLSVPDINNAGLVVFRSQFISGSQVNGIFTPTSKLAAVGDVIGGETLNTIISGPGINNNGEVVFKARYDGTVGGGFFTPNGDLIKTGETLNNGTLIHFPGANQPTINSSGVTAFEYFLSNSKRGVAISSGSSTDGTSIAAVGDTIAGVTWSGIAVGSLAPVINDNGVVAWAGTGTGAIDTIWTSQNRIVAQEGDTIGGKEISGLVFESVSINNLNQIGYIGSVVEDAQQAVFLEQMVIAGKNDIILGQTLTAIGGNLDINNSGQVLFQGKLNGVSSLILANVETTAVPELSGFSLMLMGAAGLMSMSIWKRRPIPLTNGRG
ncbi:MAG: hypothetical protein O2955_15820 [Planctomycetota bacterium]|nr:hypothetical protein [Planctomycetota bacterium]MDA1213983.1 hypothetical protein [Planctomycetota bacterium]